MTAHLLPSLGVGPLQQTLVLEGPDWQCVRAAERLSYTEVKERLNLTDEDVLRLLHSLSLAKFKILGKEPANKTLSKSDTFFFNAKFTSAMRRIRVRTPPRLQAFVHWPAHPSSVACRQREAARAMRRIRVRTSPRLQPRQSACAGQPSPRL